MNTLKTLDAVNSLLASLPVCDDLAESAQRKAEVLCTFAAQVDKMLFTTIGIETNTNAYCSNRIAVDMGSVVDDQVPDAIRGLLLGEVRHGLKMDERGEMYISYEFTFCPTRIVLRFGGKRPIAKTLTYEEAAQLVVFHLAEQLLRVMRWLHNEQARALLPIYDRIESVLFPRE